MEIVMKDGRTLKLHWNSLKARLVRGLLPPVLFGYIYAPPGGRRRAALEELESQGIVKIDGSGERPLVELRVENIKTIKDLGKEYGW